MKEKVYSYASCVAKEVADLCVQNLFHLSSSGT